MTAGSGGGAPLVSVLPGTRVRLLDSPYTRSMNATFGEATVLEHDTYADVLTVEPDLPPWVSGFPSNYLYPKTGQVELLPVDPPRDPNAAEGNYSREDESLDGTSPSRRRRFRRRRHQNKRDRR